MAIPNPKKYSLGEMVNIFPKAQYDFLKEFIDAFNLIESTSLTTPTATIEGVLVTGVVTENHTPAAVNATATATAEEVATGVITSTSAAGVALTLPSAADLLAAIGGATKAWFDFAVDNSAGSNTVTVTPSASITAATAVITGGATLTVASGAVGLFRIYFSSGTVAKIYRIG